jgi:magnesium and cobalt exporter, CNNM family
MDRSTGSRVSAAERLPSGSIETLWGAVAVVVLILANGLFVAGEFALVAADADRVEALAAEGRRSARLVTALLRRLSFHLSGAQLGITITSLLLGFIAEDTVGRLVGPLLELIPGVEDTEGGTLRIVVALAVATVLQMVLGELVPKNVAIARPEPTALALAPLLRVYGIVASPAIRLLDGTANRLVRMLGVEPRAELRAERTLEDYELLMRASAEHGSLSARDARLLTRALRFATKTAAEALQPRMTMVSIPHTTTVAELAALSTATGRSRIVVSRGGDLDDVVGVAFVADVFSIPAAERAATPVTAITRDATIVPESRDLDELLDELRADGRRLAVVVDEYGGTAGVITLEDLLEEIVGEIHDEHDEATSLTQPRRAGGYTVDGTLHRDEVLDLAGFEMPDGEFETIAGFLLVLFDRIPDVGERTESEGWRFEVLERDGLRVARIALAPLPARTEAEVGS